MTNLGKLGFYNHIISVYDLSLTIGSLKIALDMAVCRSTSLKVSYFSKPYLPHDAKLAETFPESMWDGKLLPSTCQRCRDLRYRLLNITPFYIDQIDSIIVLSTPLVALLFTRFLFGVCGYVNCFCCDS